MKTIGIIPARMASSRFPGKSLAPLLGLALVLHVWERCRRAVGLDRLVVATCDEEIRSAVIERGGEAIMTADTHPGCVDRTVEAIEKLQLGLADDDLVVMVQGDEATISPDMLEQVIQTYRRTRAPVVNLCTAITRAEDLDDPNCVKACAAPDGRALFFSRSPIPCRARASTAVPVYQQGGIIGFSRSFLETFGRLKRTPLEMIEHIDMLRTLEHGYTIQVVTDPRSTIAVDTPDDLRRAEEQLRGDPLTRLYLPDA